MSPARVACLLVAGVLGLLAGCAPKPSSQARLRYLETEKKALLYRLESLRSTEQQDLRITELKRQAIARAERIDATALSGDGDFLTLHESLFTDLIDALMPFTWEHEGHRFTFRSRELRLSPEGVLLQLGYRVEGPSLAGQGDKPPEGKLRCRVVVQPDAEGGLWLHFEPELLSVDERYHRLERVLLERFPPQTFAGVMPDLALPLGLPQALTWQGRTLPLKMQFDPAQMIVLPERVLIPFAYSPGPPQGPAAAPTPIPDPDRSVIPVGRSPGTGR